MLNLERIPDQVGYLLLTEDGAVISVSIIFSRTSDSVNFLIKYVLLAVETESFTQLYHESKCYIA
jgi:hypothetical protein